MKTEIDNIVKAFNDHNATLNQEQLAAMKPAMEVLSRNLNNIAFTSDVITCLVSDLQDLNEPAIKTILDKYAVSVNKSDDFLKTYTNIQAIIKRAQDTNGQTPQV